MKSVAALGIGSALAACTARVSPANFQSAPIKKLYPAQLKQGDKVGIIAPASAIFKEETIQDFSFFLERMGFEVVVGDAVRKKYGSLAGTDKERAKDLNQMFKRKDIKGIFTMRGGWGSARILHLIDYRAIIENPKFFMGYSDITALINAIFAQTGLITFHGPVGYSPWNGFTSEYFRKLVLENEMASYISPETKIDHIETIRNGEAEGELIGGNLSVLDGILGSRYMPDARGKILFLEEINEEVYRIDRMLTQLRLSGVLEQINGFVFGKCKSCDPEDPEHSLTFQQVMNDHIRPLGIPAFYGALIGHIDDQFTIPIGAKARINAKSGVIELLEKAFV